MESLIFDTTFLIDYQRERKIGDGKAPRFLRANETNSIFLPVIVEGEFREGFTALSDTFFRLVVDSFLILPITGKVASVYSIISRDLRLSGISIGANDLWIAAVALDRGFPLVTRNLDHFFRIPTLQLCSY